MSHHIHVVIPDTQIRPGVPTAHLSWIGRYIVDHFAGRPNVRLIHLGDHWDMPSLSSYDKGKATMEGRRYKADIRAGNDAWDLLNEPVERFNKGRREPWIPESMDFLLGNHENRITRACDEDPKLIGTIGLDDLNAGEWGWTVHPFLTPVRLDGVYYAHYFHPPMSDRPYSGSSMDARLKSIGHSFTMGHQQCRMWGVRPVGTTEHCGLVVGACYLHDETYKGPQGNRHWRGIVVCHRVNRGAYDPMFVSLAWLCEKYTGKTLREFLRAPRAAA